MDASAPPARPPATDRPSPIPAARAEIDRIDEEILDLITRRVRAARHAFAERSRRGLPLRDPAREAVVVRRAAEGARRRGLDAEGVRDVFWRLVDLSHRDRLHAAAGAGPEPLP